MRVARVPVADRWLAVAVLVVAQVEVWTLGHGTAPRVLATGASVVVAAGIGLRRVAPVAALAAVVAATGFVFAFEDVASDDDAYFPAFALMFAVYSAGAHARRLRGVAGVLALVVAPVMLSLGDRDGLSADSVLFFEIFVGPAFAAGVAIAHRRRRELELTRHAERLDRDRERAAETAVSLERARIARELHDVVAHAISVIVVQAQGGVRMVRAEPVEAEQAFGAIERTGRQALGEMRRLLGMLSADDDGELAPQPSLGHLDALIAEVERAGLPVELVREGDAACVPPGVDVSAYRIVQEALTNALKHAGPASATVRVRCLPTAVEVEVADDGHGAPATNGGGHGLTGMRERVALYGGRLEAGARPSGGFTVSARLPFETR
jgi:signal transduction histidine kinase